MDKTHAFIQEHPNFFRNFSLELNSIVAAESNSFFGYDVQLKKIIIYFTLGYVISSLFLPRPDFGNR